MEPTTSSPSHTTEVPSVPRGALLFCLVLMLIGCVFLVLSFRRFLWPEPRIVPMASYNVAEEAKKYVRQNKAAPLSGKLQEILEQARNDHFDSYQHPLVGTIAPEFTRDDTDGQPWSLKEALKKGPVIVVFYLGYHCNHCVSQLFDLNEDLALFEELGVQIVALSPDSPELTRARYEEYGAFRFPVLADRGNRVAEAYGVYKPATGVMADDLEHGTFVLDSAGVVRWAAFGPAPFGHNPTLLYEVGRIKGLMK